jgi:carbonic anhydrase/acetyltransferase-like protein (isoleucine patch superfamily)
MEAYKMIVPDSPKISRSAFIDKSATILGDVTIGDSVYVAPNASIRADEPGSKIIIGNHCNIQDNVVIHALHHSIVKVGSGTTLAHSCVVHGPCAIGEGCFVGFGTVVFQCTLMDGCVLLHRALVTHTLIPSSRLVANGAIIEGELKVAELPPVPKDMVHFVDSVRETNIKLAQMYKETDRNHPRPMPGEDRKGEILPINV